MPLILASGKRLSPAVVTGTGVAVSAILCVALFLLVRAMKP
jgi:preprotein translocase subunit Sec61beta